MSARTVHPFPARMAPEIALNSIPERDDSPALRVLDPMCGSGTVLSAAVARGHDAIGIDIDPLAVLMSSVATSSIDDDSIAKEADSVVREARGFEGTKPWKDDATEKFVDFWFAPSQKKQLIALSSAISHIDDIATRAVLQIALSRIIITKTPQASLAADTSHSRPHRVITESDYDVHVGFERSLSKLRTLLQKRNLFGTAIVKRGDSRSLHSVSTNSIDLIVTSPPYLNALDYMRGHKLALVWLGWSILELRELRGKSIGAERAPTREASQQVQDLIDFIKQDVVHPELLPFRTLERFAGDMHGFASATNRVLKADGRILLVIGNSTLRGNYIRNDEIVKHAFKSQGLLETDRYEREIPANHRYMPINSKSGSAVDKRMRKEVVLTFSRD